MGGESSKKIKVGHEERLLQLHDIFSEVGIRFFLLFGTCLGYYRDGHAISSDEDVDIGFLMKDFDERLIELLDERIGSLKCFYIHKKLRIIKLGARGCPGRFSPWIDISPLHESDYGYWFLKDPLKYNYNKEERKHLMGIRYPRAWFDNLKQIEIAGKDFYLPGKPKDYLVSFYGPNWKRPQRRSQYMPDPPNQMKNFIEFYK